MLKPRTALVIYNPTAGAAADMDLLLGAVTHNLCTHGEYIVTVRQTIRDMNSQQAVELITPDCDLVVAAGGDGTVRLVLGAVSQRSPGTPVALIPVGTGNQLARNLNIYQENILTDPLAEAIATMLNGEKVRIDLGVMNNEYFCVAAGAGPLSDAVITPTRQEKANFRMLAYVGSMIQTFASPPVVFNVRIGATKFPVSASGLFITNVADLGVGTLSESAHLSDGLLDLCIMNPTEFADYIELGFRFAGMFVGGEAPYYIRKVASVDIDVIETESQLSGIQAIAHKVRTTLSGQPDTLPKYAKVMAMIDGDASGTTPMHVEVKPDAVTVLARGLTKS
jgi:diacylglycerol kinase (ATP)